MSWPMSRIRDYIHVSDFVRAHSAALSYLRAGGAAVTLATAWFLGA
jgi:UDP-glucose 4-epimerase